MPTMSMLDAPAIRRRPRRAGFALLAVLGVLFAVASVGWAAFAGLSVLVRQQATASASYAGIHSVTLDGSSADLSVIAAPGDAVRLDQQLQWSFGRPTVSVSRVGDQLTIHTHCPLDVGWSCVVRLTLRVPAQTNLSVHSGSGNVSATGLSAAATLVTRNGNVSATAMAGGLTAQSGNGNVTVADSTMSRLEASTSNGNVRVQLAVSPSEVQATSHNGNVDVLLPDQPGVGYDVNANTHNGNRNVAVQLDSSAPRHITVQSSNGNVKVAYP
jgi:hypothetical protein